MREVYDSEGPLHRLSNLLDCREKKGDTHSTNSESNNIWMVGMISISGSDRGVERGSVNLNVVCKCARDFRLRSSDLSVGDVEMLRDGAEVNWHQFINASKQ